MKIKKIDDFKLNESIIPTNQNDKDNDDSCAEYGFLIEKELRLKDVDGYYDFMYADYNSFNEDIITFEYYFNYISDITFLNRISKYPKFKILSGNHDNFDFIDNKNQIYIKFDIALSLVKEKKILF